jgi:hypothetical protein
LRSRWYIYLVCEVDLLSGTGWVRAVVAADDTRVCTRFARTVGPSGCSSCSDLETAYGSFVQDLGCWGGSHEAGESEGQCVVQ